MKTKLLSHHSSAAASPHPIFIATRRFRPLHGLRAVVWLALSVLTFSLSMTAATAAPSNDSFAKAKLILPSQGLQGVLGNESNAGATAEPGEPAIAGAPASHTVWYRFNAPTGMTVYIDVVDNLGLRMNCFQMYNEGSFESLVSGLSTNNTNPGDIEHLAGIVGPDNSLFLAVDSSQTGNFSIRYRFSATASDYLADATVLSGASGNSYLNTQGATLEAGEPSTLSGDTHTVWWKWTAPSTASYSFDTIGSSFPTVVEVFSGSDINSLTQVALNAGAYGFPDSAALVTFSASAGTTYYIRVYGQTKNSGYCQLNYYLSSGAGQFSFHRPGINGVGLGSSYPFSVRRLMGTSGAASITVTTSSSPGGPVANTDYVPISQTLNFAAGEIEKQLSLSTLYNTKNPPNNFIVSLSLSNPTNGSVIAPFPAETAENIFLSVPTAQTTPSIRLLTSSVTVTEGQYALIPFERQGNPDVPVSQTYTLVPAAGSLRQAAGVDLNYSITASLDPGNTVGSLLILVPDDYVFEGPEDVQLKIGNSSAAAIHILDNELARPPAAVYEIVQSGGTGLGMFTCRIMLSPSGSFTGQIRSHAGTFAFKGTVAADGSAVTYIPRTTGLGEMQVNLQFKQGFTKMHCHIQSPSGDVVNDFDSPRARVAADGTSPQAGNYTFYAANMFIGGNLVNNPLFGTLSITSAGAVKMVAKLVGGETFTMGSQQDFTGGVHGSFLAPTHEFVGLNFTPGSVAGVFDLSGAALLQKFPFAGDKLFPGGVSSTAGAVNAIRYTPPAAGNYLLSAWQPSGAGKLVTSGGGTVGGLSLPFTASTLSTVQFASQTALPVVKLAPTTGAFTGTVQPSGHVSVPFSGIMYQGTGSYSLGIGNFVADGQPGAVTLSGP